MKNKKYLNIVGIFFAAMLLFASCQKDDPVKLAPQFATWGISNITSTSADISGFVVAEGDGFTEHGVCWVTTSTLATVDDSKLIVEEIDKAVFVANVTGLDHLTKYYVRAYVIDNSGAVTYGDSTSFTTLANLATINIDPITAITATTATSGGDVPYDGKSAVTAKGLVWSMEVNPAIDSTNVVISEDGEGTGTFTTNLTGLIGGITYYVRAYATNEIGTAYSDQLSFTTEAGLPVVSTDSVESIAKTSFTMYGTVPYTGGASITERGFCWATSENPTIADDNVADAENTTGVMSADITGLTAGTNYYVRAYATNSEGTAYGDNYEVETIGEFFIVGSINGWNNHGQYMAYLGDGVFVAYQHLENADQFKFFPVRDTWDNGWGAEGGDCGTAGTAVLGGGNICANNQSGFSVDGFYEIKFNATNETVELTLISSMGVIGDAQAGAWDTDVDLTFNTTTSVWEGQVTFLGTGAYKFRANDDWDINFGGALTDLTSGGDNMASPAAGTYDVVLDLSGPDNFNSTVTPVK